MNIVLTGFMGSGKTTVGKNLAQKLNMDFVDLDDLIFKKSSLSIQIIFRDLGEFGFRKIEKDCLKDLLTVKNTVITVGGGAILDDECFKIISRLGWVFLLDASPETTFDRLVRDRNKRPILSDLSVDKIIEIKNSRRKTYDKIKCIVNADGKSVEEISSDIEAILKKPRYMNFRTLFKIVDKTFFVIFNMLVVISLYKTFTVGSPSYYPYYIWSIIFFTIMFFMKYGREDS